MKVQLNFLKTTTIKMISGVQTYKRSKVIMETWNDYGIINNISVYIFILIVHFSTTVHSTLIHT